MYLRCSVTHKQGIASNQSPMKGNVQEVASLLAPLMTMDEGSPNCVTRVRNLLDHHYAGKVTETSSAAKEYHLVWNGDFWCLVCRTSSTLEIAFGTDETVVVAVEQDQHYST